MPLKDDKIPGSQIVTTQKSFIHTMVIFFHKCC